MKKRNNNPPILIEFESEMVEFMIENCEANISYALTVISTSGLSEQAIQNIITTLEKFKTLLKILNQAKQS